MCKGPVIVYWGVRGEGRGAGKFWGDYMVFRGDRRRISSRQQSQGGDYRKLTANSRPVGDGGGGGRRNITEPFPSRPGQHSAVNGFVLFIAQKCLLKTIFLSKTTLTKKKKLTYQTF